MSTAKSPSSSPAAARVACGPAPVAAGESTPTHRRRRGQEGEHVVKQLLNHKTLRGRTYCLVPRWQGPGSDTPLRLAVLKVISKIVTILKPS